MRGGWMGGLRQTILVGALGLFDLHDFIGPVVQQSILNLGSAESLGQFVLGGFIDGLGGHGGFTHHTNHNVMGESVGGAVGVRLGVQAFQFVGQFITQGGGVHSFAVKEGNHGFDGVLLHTGSLSGF